MIPDRINPSSQTADVFIADVYSGKGLAGVERGTVKSIRLISYQFAYQGMGAEPYSVGLDGPWDPKTILGTVPVNDDGSASFRIPAMMPVAFQMLDADGKAVQLMRSWITAIDFVHRLPRGSKSDRRCCPAQRGVQVEGDRHYPLLWSGAGVFVPARDSADSRSLLRRMPRRRGRAPRSA